MSINFHRLSPVPYFVSEAATEYTLPTGYDFINNPVQDGYTDGLPAAAAGMKLRGPNQGTYFVAFGEDAIGLYTNRPAQALSTNTDYLDNLMHRDVAVPVMHSFTIPTGGSQTVTLPEPAVGEGGIFLGGTARTPAGDYLDLFHVCDSGDEDLALVDQITGVTFPVLVEDAVDQGTASSASPCFSGGTVQLTFNATIPAGTVVRIYYAVRGNLASFEPDALTFTNIRTLTDVSYQVEELLSLLQAPPSLLAPWDGPEAPTTRGWFSTIWDLAMSGLNERYNRSTSSLGITPPENYWQSAAFNEQGSGGWILRSGPALTVYSDGDNYPLADPVNALFSAKNIDTDAGGTGGVVDFVAYGSRRASTQDSGETRHSRVPGSALFLGLWPHDFNHGPNKVTNVGSGETAVLSTVGGLLQIELTGGGWFHNGTDSSVSIGRDLLEFSSSTTNRQTFVVVALGQPPVANVAYVRQLSGAMPSYVSPVSGTVRFISTSFVVGDGAGPFHAVENSDTNPVLLDGLFYQVPPDLYTTSSAKDDVTRTPAQFSAQTADVASAALQWGGFSSSLPVSGPILPSALLGDGSLYAATGVAAFSHLADASTAAVTGSVLDGSKPGGDFVGGGPFALLGTAIFGSGAGGVYCQGDKDGVGGYFRGGFYMSGTHSGSAGVLTFGGASAGSDPQTAFDGPGLVSTGGGTTIGGQGSVSLASNTSSFGSVSADTSWSLDTLNQALFNPLSASYLFPSSRPDVEFGHALPVGALGLGASTDGFSLGGHGSLGFGTGQGIGVLGFGGSQESDTNNRNGIGGYFIAGLGSGTRENTALSGAGSGAYARGDGYGSGTYGVSGALGGAGACGIAYEGGNYGVFGSAFGVTGGVGGYFISGSGSGHAAVQAAGPITASDSITITGAAGFIAEDGGFEGTGDIGTSAGNVFSGDGSLFTGSSEPDLPGSIAAVGGIFAGDVPVQPVAGGISAAGELAAWGTVLGYSGGWFVGAADLYAVYGQASPGVGVGFYGVGGTKSSGSYNNANDGDGGSFLGGDSPGTGVGSGRGASGYGGSGAGSIGASDSVGLYGEGGSGGSYGVFGKGTGSFAGGYFKASAAAGVEGHTSDSGYSGLYGYGPNLGVLGESSGYGVRGSGAIAGVYGSGSDTAPGGYFTPGTEGQPAALLDDGPLRCTYDVATPDTAPSTQALYATNIVKAWGQLTILVQQGSPPADSCYFTSGLGFNLGNVSAQYSDVTGALSFTLATPLVGDGVVQLTGTPGIQTNNWGAPSYWGYVTTSDGTTTVTVQVTSTVWDPNDSDPFIPHLTTQAGFTGRATPGIAYVNFLVMGK